MIKVNICSLLNMHVAFACVRTSIVYKCSKFAISARNARNVKSQQLPSNQFRDLLLNHVATRMTVVLQTIIFYVNESLSHLSNEIENNKQAHC